MWGDRAFSNGKGIRREGKTMKKGNNMCYEYVPNLQEEYKHCVLQRCTNKYKFTAGWLSHFGVVMRHNITVSVHGRGGCSPHGDHEIVRERELTFIKALSPQPFKLQIHKMDYRIHEVRPLMIHNLPKTCP